MGKEMAGDVSTGDGENTEDEGIDKNVEKDLKTLVAEPKGLTIKVDHTKTNPTSALASNPSFTIDDSSPAAEALRANALVKVTKLRKFARGIHAQSIFNSKKATFGNRKGKPPRVPDVNNGLAASKREGKASNDQDSIEEDLGVSDGLIVDFESNKTKSGKDKEILEMEESMKKDADSFEGETVSMKEVGDKKQRKKIKDKKEPDESKEEKDQRKAKRRKKKLGKRIKKGKHANGRVINSSHELYILSITMMLGLRTAIRFTNIELRKEKDRGQWLESDDFMTIEKYSFPPKGGKYGGKETPPHQIGHTFKFKDYSPLAFAYIRKLFGVDENDFLYSICGNANLIEFISNAKSGQFFFYSYDGKYMIKTMTDAESKFLRRILPHYFKHCVSNPNTLLPRFLGMYRVKLYHLRRTVKFIIMNSIFDTKKPIQKFFDLKGSTIGRDAPNQAVMKDNDMRRGFPDSTLNFSEDVRIKLRNQVVSDCNFMTKMKIMDYSMLVGVSHTPFNVEGEGSSRSLKNIGGLSFKDLGTQKKADFTSSTARQIRNLHFLPSHHSGEPTSLISPSSQFNPYIVNESKTDENSDEEQNKEIGHQGNMNFAMADKELDNSLASQTSEFLEDKMLESILDRSVTSHSTFDNYFEDEDENSYIDMNNTQYGPKLFIDGKNKSEDYWTIQKLLSDLKKDQATETMFWPFHRFYNVKGQRRTTALYASDSSQVNQGEESLRDKWRLPDFVAPISNRVDRGLEMDVSKRRLPMKYIGPDNKVQFINGKIYFVGIIDILQEFNARKRFEARYRRLKGGGWEGASCVHPELYADRFVRFFDEYTNFRSLSTKAENHDNEEEIVFSC
mmetsp:Transcript_14458/g.20614  ORF Transcript_14458/g.20614 Transcript_14458/m.20614 type:complete len:846 (+) Transcript_14458:108-2645(+)|eukprot:CAMPEP_0184867532 /NCGR_PEP_ID=MMETSP0580-20130426/26970_1 /TAXON_ID=1118495 /ORGANISM="Dactyliosolen fragilissimus" /LENGTH=845 /DNA_ID=CAMNT_0027367883 /DNA_START=14 /DNA_END=2551 /DNA_ORIENTATION=+